MESLISRAVGRELDIFSRAVVRTSLAGSGLQTNSIWPWILNVFVQITKGLKVLGNFAPFYPNPSVEILALRREPAQWLRDTGPISTLLFPDCQQHSSSFCIDVASSEYGIIQAFEPVSGEILA